MSTPSIRQINDLAGFPDGLDGLDGLDQDGALLGRIVRLTQGMAERPFEENGAGRLDFFRLFPDD